MPINGFLYPGAKFTPPYQVANSCRFDDGSSDTFTRSNGTPTNLKKFTISLWFKRTEPGLNKYLITGFGDEDNRTLLQFSSDQLLFQNATGGSNNTVVKSNAQFRDPSTWYHFCVIVDTTQSTDSNRVKMYVNGSQITSLASSTYPSQNTDMELTDSSNSIILNQKGDGSDYNSGYYAEVVVLDGTAASITDFGEFDSDSPNIWKPKDVSGLTFGNNGFYLDFEKDETSTNFIDRSSNARTITAAGNVHHSLDQAKFNDSSIEFDGTGDNLQVADSSDFDFGTGDFTFELFVYKQTSGKMAVFETRTYSGSGGEGFNLEFSSANKLEWYDGSLTADLPGDPSAISLNTWTHYAIVRYNNVCTMYKNGTSVGTPKDVGSASQNSTRGPIIGEVENGDNDFDGYMDEIRLSNVARYTGNFTAPTSPFTSDSNTVLLIQSNASNKIGADVSGQGNHFESSGITSEDQSTDTCTNNFATFNSAQPALSNTSFSEGNLVAATTSSASTQVPFATTIPISTGKFYAEFKMIAKSTTSGSIPYIGVLGAANFVSELNNAYFVGGSNLDGVGYGASGVVYSNGSELDSSEASYDTNDIIGVAADITNKKIYFSKNGTYINSGDPAAGSNGYTIPTTSQGFYIFAASLYGASGSWGANFGSPSFSISSGNSDANGYGNFEYTVPSGYYSLNTKNLAEFG